MRVVEKVSRIAMVGFLVACGSDGPTQTEPEANHVRIQFASAEPGTFETSGDPVFPTDYSRDFVGLGTGGISGVFISHQVLAVNAESAYLAGGADDFLLYLNPLITRPGRYDPGDCPQPTAVGGCFSARIRFGIPTGGGNEVIFLRAIQDSVSITVQTITADTLRATFEGRFLVISAQPNQRLTVTQGTLFAVRRSQ